MDSHRRSTNTDTLSQVAGLMADLLGLPEFGPDQDFFQSGGHSLQATQLLSRVHQQFSVELPLRCAFDAPTPRALTEHIAAATVRSQPPVIPAVDRTRPLPLSFSQERMWMLHQLDPQGSAYNVTDAMWIDGPLDTIALQRALDEVLRRHEVLRSHYPTIDGTPVAVVRPALSLALPLRDLGAVADAEGAALAAAGRFIAEPFELASDVLIRMSLWQVGARRHLLAVSLHHLICDTWSMGLLFAELMRFYDTFVEGSRPTAALPEPSYLDYAAWQRGWLDDQRLAADFAYWTRQLAGASPVELPADRQRTANWTTAGEALSASLPPALMTRLLDLSRAQGVTLFMTMYAAFQVLLFRHTGSSDLVVGVPVANRNRLATEPLLGSLVNTLAVRLQFDAEQAFLTLLKQVREAALDACQHQELPFGHLVSALPLERRVGESPLVSVMFDFQDSPLLDHTTGSVRTTPVMLPRGGAQFDLTLSVQDTGDGHAVCIEYRTGLYEATTMQRLLSHYVAILEQVVRDPLQNPATIPLLTSGERRELLALAETAESPAGTPEEVPAAVARQARQHPERMAVCDEAGGISYAELERQASVLAARLLAASVADGERVAVMLERDRRLVVALLATQKCGAAYVPLDPSYPADRIGHVLDDSRPKVVVTLSSLRSQLPLDWRQHCLCLDEPGEQVHAATLSPPLRPRPDRIAYILYTSGSTGRPKGVEVPAAALANFLRSMAHTPGIAADDRVLALTTIAFDIAGLELWLPLTHGASLRLVPAATAADAVALRALMKAWRPTLMQATPATWKMLLAIDWEGDSRLRMLCGGEAMPPELGQSLLKLGAELWNMYGPTETTIWSTVHRVTAADQQRVPVGRPIDHTRIYVLDRHGQLQPRGVAGELYIGGAGVARGYHGRPDLTGERFLPDPYATGSGARMYRTGDAGRLRADGNFECLARLDDQIKLRGFRIEPGEIEAVFKEDARVRDAVVQAREVQPGDVRLVAWYVPVSMQMATPQHEEQLRAHLQRRLPPYMIPAALMALEALPKTPNGKTDRRALPTPRFEGTSGTDAYVAPRSEVERKLAEIWQELLAIPQIGVRDSFFALGGYSLLAMRMFARIQQAFGVMLPPAVLFEHPTIEHLAEQVRQDGKPRPGATPPARSTGRTRYIASRPLEHVVAINPGGTQTPLFCVHGAGGNVYTFAPLAERLGQERPLFGLQARGVDGILSPHQEIATMAEAYLREIREVQASGPYLLAGYCGGGVIAFEMACRLREAGEQVAMLAMIDSYRPGVATTAPRKQRWTEGLRNEGPRYLLRKGGEWLRRHVREQRARWSIAFHRKVGRPVPFALRDYWLTHSFMDSEDRWRPGRFDGELVLLRAMQTDPELVEVGRDLGWSGHASAIRTYDVPGNHLDLLDVPNIDVLAATLVDRLGEAEAGEAP